jgi:hypothetical protein
MTKALGLTLLAAFVFVSSSALAQGRTGMEGKRGMMGKRACTFQACFDRCIQLGGPNGSSLTNKHCGNRCRRRCT